MSNNCSYVYDAVWPEEKQRNSLILILSLLISLSALCLMVALHNIYRYLIKDGRWRVFLLTTFYGSLVVMLVFQIWNAALVIQFFGVEPDCSVVFTSLEFDTCAIYSAALFGVFQAASIIELFLLTKHNTAANIQSHFSVAEIRLDSQIRCLYRLTCIVVVILISSMAIFLIKQPKEGSLFEPTNSS